jgi:hypothetical protein
MRLYVTLLSTLFYFSSVSFTVRYDVVRYGTLWGCMQVTWDYKLEMWGNRPEKSASKPDWNE